MRARRNTPATEKKKRARLNSADIMIFLLCVVCIAGLVLRFVVLDKIESNASAQSATVTMLIEGVSDTSREYLSESARMYLEDGTTLLGTVRTVSATPSPVYIYEDDGSITRMDSVNGKVDIRIELDVSGVNSESGFMLGGTVYIAPNMSLPVKTSTLAVTGLITDITVSE